MYRVRIMATVRGVFSVGSVAASGEDSRTEVYWYIYVYVTMCVVCACSKVYT